MNIACFRKYYTTIKDSIFKLVVETLDSFGLQEGTHYKKTVSPLHIRLHNGSIFDFKGLDSIEKTKGLEGYHRAIIEEANELNESDFDTIDMSIRGRGYDTKIYLMHNPIPLIAGQQHWLQKRFLNVIPHKLGENATGLVNNEKAVVLKTTYLHNHFVPETVKNILEGYRQTNPDLYKMWALGEFTELKGGILDNGYKVVNEVSEGIKFLGYGVDFGFANDQTGVIGVWKRDRQIYMKEIVYETGLTNPQIYSRMLERGINRNDSIVAESARPDQIQELFDLGLKNIRKCKKYEGHKKEAAQYLRGCELFVLKGSVNLMSELSSWSWQTNKDGVVKPDAKPADGNDHLIDALIYRLAVPKPSKKINFTIG